MRLLSAIFFYSYLVWGYSVVSMEWILVGEMEMPQHFWAASTTSLIPLLLEFLTSSRLLIIKAINARKLSGLKVVGGGESVWHSLFTWGGLDWVVSIGVERQG